MQENEQMLSFNPAQAWRSDGPLCHSTNTQKSQNHILLNSEHGKKCKKNLRKYALFNPYPMYRCSNDPMFLTLTLLASFKHDFVLPGRRHTCNKK